MTRLRIEYDFHAVGQGLFSSGSLRTDQGTRRFRWVYDCGTASSQTQVRLAIEKFARRAIGVGRPSLDLVAVSHFDRDHITGLVTLLSTHRVKTLLLPYMPLWQRLTIADSEGVSPDEPLFSLFLDPVSYVTGIDGAQIGRIILVPPSGDAGPDAGAAAPPPTGEGDDPWPLDIDASEPHDEEQREDFNAMVMAAKQAGTIVRFLRPGGSVRAAGLWEFIPYNDASLAPKADDAFRSKISDLQTRLIKPGPRDDRANVIARIKETYDATFGDGSQNRNMISLFLYGGPLRGGPAHLQWIAGTLLRAKRNYRQWGPSRRPKVSILYTGDGYLNTPRRADRLLSYLGDSPYSRVGQLGAVQVMHHGARANWYKGIAARLTPCVSVFSSDPAHKQFGHPHKPVVDDFAPYGPVQVDKSRDCYILAEVEF